MSDLEDYVVTYTTEHYINVRARDPEDARRRVERSEAARNPTIVEVEKL